MATSLLKELCNHLDHLVTKKSMTILKETRSHAFDNGMVEITSDDFDIRIIRDRGTVFIELSPTMKNEWIDLHTIIKYISKSEVSREIEKLSVLLEANYKIVSALMTSNLDKLKSYEKKLAPDFVKKFI